MAAVILEAISFWLEFELSAPALNRVWDLNGVAVVLRRCRQSGDGVMFTLFDRP